MALSFVFGRALCEVYYAGVCVSVLWWTDLTYSDYGHASYPYMLYVIKHKIYNVLYCIVHVKCQCQRHGVQLPPCSAGSASGSLFG